MSSHPSPISSLKLRVIQGSNTYEKVIPSSSSETTNIFPITNQTFPELFNAFNSQPLGTIFNPSIVATYTPGTFATGDVLSTPSTQANFVPRQITPTFSVADIPEKTTADEPFSLADLVTKTGTGVVSYSSSAPSVATVISSGLVTIAGAGVTNITFSLAVSADGVYKAATPITRTLTVIPSVPVVLDANNVTIKYVGNPSYVPTSSALFIQANPHGTGDEWFAVVKDGMKQAINDYAKGISTTPFERIPGDNSTLVPFNNIVTTLMTDMSYMFQNASTFNEDTGEWTSFNEDISEWDVSSVTNMSNMFESAWLFNQPLNYWNVSNVESMNSMFINAEAFNQPLNLWDVSSVKYMRQMFTNAKLFNQDISMWNVSLVEDMDSMFKNTNFDQPLNDWDVSSVNNMAYMFENAKVFNQPLYSWDVSAVTNMKQMFLHATLFNQDISMWDVSSVLTRPPIWFSDNSALTAENSPIWFPIVVLDANNVTIKYTGLEINVPTSSALFIKANSRGTGNEWFAVVKDGMKQAITDYANGTSNTPFVRIPGDNSTLVPLNNIVTTLMTDMSYMFQNASTFNSVISSWDVSNVLNMHIMFSGASIFNQPLNSWNVSSVTNMGYMFTGAFAFNQPLNAWNVSAVENMNGMFGVPFYGSPPMTFNQNISGWDVSSVTPKPPPNFRTGSPLTDVNTPIWFP
jgi:surface protein